MRVERTAFLWVRWPVDSGYSSWHQVREDSVPQVLEGEVLYVLRLWTRCGFEVPDPQALEVWSGSSAPVGLTCVHCTRSFFVDTLPPLGTPPVPEGRQLPGGRRFVRFIIPRRPKGSLPASPGSADRAHV